MIDFKLTRIFESLPVKTALVALFAYLLARFLFFNEIPDFKSTTLAIISITIVAAFLGTKFGEFTIASHFFIGAISYSIFTFLNVFLKFTTTMPLITDELKIAAIFGGIAAAAFVQLN